MNIFPHFLAVGPSDSSHTPVNEARVRNSLSSFFFLPRGYDVWGSISRVPEFVRSKSALGVTRTRKPKDIIDNEANNADCIEESVGKWSSLMNSSRRYLRTPFTLSKIRGISSDLNTQYDLIASQGTGMVNFHCGVSADIGKGCTVVCNRNGTLSFIQRRSPRSAGYMGKVIIGPE
ncbi:uncharacterized protein FOMMEDRAFT_152712 [Fomitiporia mediterranea MF3/22]|uniref:uncharacterized protein n=1 Tax=Fomitiporia mediterranea (strain MF3/22) TaxID=694068 RepID=UPI00044099A7|nr:uncharacterized protein FOMMEDRAFT_152712 [Fomitiporia mediterranea MF3/22]EJD05408.1 hypothetical protein FOMMEDRAFT_152712 [Fomitiporia mediterranea MF3/22]